MLQQEDLVMFGRLIMGLCCNNLGAANNLPKSMEQVGRYYTAEVKNILLYLLTKPSPIKVCCSFTSSLYVLIPRGLEHTPTIRTHEESDAFGDRRGTKVCHPVYSYVTRAY